MNTMMDAQEVLELFDLEVGYGTDEYSRKVLQSLDNTDKRKHVTNRRQMSRYINEYIERKYKEENNRMPFSSEERDTIIKIEGATKATKYERDSIYKMLKEDQRINKLLHNQNERKSIKLPGGEIVPKVVLEYYNAEISGIVEEIEEKEFIDEYYQKIKEDSTENLKLKHKIIENEINSRTKLNKLIESYDEVKGSRSIESLYYDIVEE